MAGGILWLASYPKSGNTWVRIFLENLFRDAAAPVSINELNVVGFGDAHIPLYERIGGRPVAGLDDSAIHALREPLQRFLAGRRETSIAKTHNLLGEYEGRPLIHLEHSMGAIYIARNVFDVTVSLARHYNLSIEDAVEAINSPRMRTPTTGAAVFQVLGRWCDHYRSWTGVDGFEPLVLRYEDMKAKPMKAFDRVVRFLKLPANPGRVAKAIKFSSFDEVSRQERAGGFRERVRDDQMFFHSGRVGGWRQHLTTEQVGRLIDVHGEVLTELGYLDKQGRPTV